MNTIHFIKIIERSWPVWDKSNLTYKNLNRIIAEEEQKEVSYKDEDIQLEKRNFTYYLMSSTSFYEIMAKLELFRDYLLAGHKHCNSAMIRMLIATLDSQRVFIKRLVEIEIKLHLLKLFQIFWLGKETTPNLTNNIKEYPQEQENDFLQMTIFKEEKKESRYEQLDQKQYELKRRIERNLEQKIHNMSVNEQEEFQAFIKRNTENNEMIKELLLEEYTQICAKDFVQEQTYPLLLYLKQNRKE